MTSSRTSGAPPVSDADVAAVREFSRFYTSVLGLLREGLLDTPYSLTEARVIFELGRQDEVEVTAMRRWLDLDRRVPEPDPGQVRGGRAGAQVPLRPATPAARSSP